MLKRLLFLFLISFIVVPLCMPVIFSFSLFWQDIFPQGFTLQWYEAILTRPRTYSALLTSLVVAFAAVSITLLISAPAAYALNRMDTPFGRWIRDTAPILTLIFPPVTVGTALVLAFSRPPLMLSGNVWMVIIAHSLIGLPFMFRNTLASFRTLNERLLSEAAASLGANLWQRLVYVIIPNVMPGILVGALVVFAISIGEFEVTSMVAGFTGQTLPLQLFQQIRNDMRIASAISSFLVYNSLLSFIAISYLSAQIRGGPDRRAA
ncbi:ABC transporter permease [Caldilinea sp.]|jgi:putative spermidine/putrescine transport system permease protein|uniref:ABC transporter permease n=1 Tax=Caldilinea sp. TaxID=2293560 RepID=UPI0021DE59E7|nr:ABC transporter permease [Caldilinea sp.]GIV69261.1 MAG: ABC transporter permease [Caldilinea sp.]